MIVLLWRPHRWPGAVMPTAVPMVAFSATVLAAALVSLTAPTSNSSTSLMVIVKHLVGERAVG